MIKCEICSREFKNIRGLTSHIIIHNLNSKQYYDKFIKKENEGLCPMYGHNPSCKKYTQYRSWRYLEHCSTRCSTLSPEVKLKYKNTNLKLYGVEHPFKNEIIWNKVKQTNIKRYGYENPLQNKDIIRKKENTNLKKYGVKTPLESKLIREKGRRTCKLIYGFNSTFEDKEKIKYFMLKKYNIDNIFKDKNVQRNILYNRRKKYLNKVNNILKKFNIELLSEYKTNNSLIKIKCKICKTIYKTKFFYILQNNNSRCPVCYKINSGVSFGEKEVLNFIKFLGFSNIIENSKKIIKPLQLDIYIPSINVAIEYNGLYFHSESKNKNRNYHLNKTIMCQDKNIQLIHIFEDEWSNNKELIKNRLYNILCNNSNYDKYNLNEINSKENITIELLDNNNKITSNIIFYRLSDNNFEIIFDEYNFITLKMFIKYFTSKYKYNNIYYIIDRRWENDIKKYNNLGFKLLKVIKPKIYYIKNNKTKISEDDNDIDILKNKEKYNRIWDCGYYKLILKNK